jgi:hypothetical protein
MPGERSVGGRRVWFLEKALVLYVDESGRTEARSQISGRRIALAALRRGQSGRGRAPGGDGGEQLAKTAGPAERKAYRIYAVRLNICSALGLTANSTEVIGIVSRTC